MKHLILTAAAFCILHFAFLITPPAADAQTITGTVPIKWVSALPSTCLPSQKTRVLVYKYTATTGLYFCSGTNTWTQLDQTASSALTLTQGTITASTPYINHTATFNSGGVTFTGFKSNITDTASAAGSLLMDLQVGGTSMFKVGKAGVVSFADGTAAAPSITFGADTNTGIYRTGPDQLGFTAAGVNHAILDGSNGRFTATGLATTSALTATQGTITSSTPFISHTATWNSGATVFDNIVSSVTDTASHVNSTLLRLAVGGTNRFYVGKTGDLSIAQGTLTTTAYPYLNHTATWNDAGTTHTAIVSNITDTNSAAASTLIDLKVGGTSQFKVNKSGTATVLGDLELGNASDTTLARSAAGRVTIEGTEVVRGLSSYLASTVTYNNVDTLADTALSVTVASGGIYDIELVVHSTSVVQPLKLDFAGTATITNFIGQWGTMPSVGAGWTDGGAALRVTAAGTDFNPGPGFTGDSFTTFKGSVEIADAGTFLLRGAQQTANASNTTLLRGSTLKLTKLN